MSAEPIIGAMNLYDVFEEWLKTRPAEYARKHKKNKFSIEEMVEFARHGLKLARTQFEAGRGASSPQATQAKCAKCGHESHDGKVCPNFVMRGVFCYCGAAGASPSSPAAKFPMCAQVFIDQHGNEARCIRRDEHGKSQHVGASSSPEPEK